MSGVSLRVRENIQWAQRKNLIPFQPGEPGTNLQNTLFFLTVAGQWLASSLAVGGGTFDRHASVFRP